MGLFNYVSYEAPCPKCGALIKEWQTKDGDCFLNTVEPWEVSHFYAPCPKCNAWVVAKVDAEVEHIVKKCEVQLAIERMPWRNSAPIVAEKCLDPESPKESSQT